MLTTHSVCVLFHFYPCWISRFHLLHGYHHDCEQCRFEHSWHVHKNIRIQIESVAKINIVNPCASEMGSFASVCWFCTVIFLAITSPTIKTGVVSIYFCQYGKTFKSSWKRVKQCHSLFLQFHMAGISIGVVVFTSLCTKNALFAWYANQYDFKMTNSMRMNKSNGTASVYQQHTPITAIAPT